MKLEQLIGEATEYDKKAMLEIKKPKSWLKSVSAFANGVGGVLIFGIADNDSVVGVDDAKKAMEVISEQIKTKMDPIPEVLLKAHEIDGKKIITLEVYRGDETPYYYVGEGNYTAFVRIGNESVIAAAMDLKRLVLRGKNRTYDSLVTDYNFDDYSFSKLKAAYYKKTKKSMEMKDFESFGIVDNLGKIRTNYGETLEKTVLSLNESRGKDPATWDEVLLDIDEVYENYTLVSTNHLQEFISFNEPYIESVTGHYACAVSALLACGAYYNAVDYTDIAGDYMDIWDSTGTTVSSESGGITYGSTTIGNIGPGFVDFCAGKNVSVTQNTDYSPNYNFFTNCIDRGDIAVVHCGIISSDTGERAGHSMAAEGYATLRAYNSGNTVHTLMVFDGWGDTVRYLNFDFDSWTDISGTTFNG